MSNLMDRLREKSVAEVKEPLNAPEGTWTVEIISFKQGRDVEFKDGRTAEKINVLMRVVAPDKAGTDDCDVSPAELEEVEANGGVDLLRIQPFGIFIEGEGDDYKIKEVLVKAGVVDEEDDTDLATAMEKAKGYQLRAFIKHEVYTQDGEERVAARPQNLLPLE